jgi:uncharacterized protein
LEKAVPITPSRRKFVLSGIAGLAAAYGYTARESTGPGTTAIQSSPALSTSPSPRSETIELYRDEIKLVGTLDVPASNTDIPLVLLLHGLSGSQEDPVIVATAQALNEAGIATLRIDLNGHGGSGGNVIDMTVPNQIEDARVAFDYARSLPFVSSIGLLGHSQGGIVSAMLAGQLRSKISALVLLAPATTIPESARAGNMMGVQFDPQNPPASITIFGLPIGRKYILTAQKLKSNSVPARFTGPVNLIHGLEDEALPSEGAKRYVKNFRHGELHLLPGQDHNFFSDPDEPAELASTFLAKHL